MFAKKSLGQNFLKSEPALLKIVESGELTPSDLVLEIGPGEGALTKFILATGANVVAVEKDDRLIPILEKTFENEIESGKFKLIHGDILEMSSDTLGLKTGEYKLIANIPYYITGLIIRKFLETEIYPSEIVLLLQKEVAERIVAKDGKESLLSMSVKVYGEPKITGIVKAGSFVPMPGVDSAILQIKNISKKFFIESGIDENKFFEIVKLGFLGKRKILMNTLSSFTSKDNLRKIFSEIGLGENARAEDITLEDWKGIINSIQ